MKKYKYLKITKAKKLRYISNYYKKKLYIVFLHGFMSDIDGEKPKAFKRFAVKKKLGFLALEYSGHGKSSGEFVRGNISQWSSDTKKLIRKMKKNSETFTRRKAEYDEFLKNKCTFYPRKIKIDAGFEGEGMKNPIKKYNPVDFNFGDENFKIKLKGSVKLISRKDNLITILADQSDYAFSINGFKDGIEDVRFRVRNYEV